MGSTAISFPSNPTIGLTYAYSAVTYKYIGGGRWVVDGAAFDTEVTYEALAANGDVGTAAGQVAAGNDSRFTDSRTPADSSVTPTKLSSAFTTLETIASTVCNWSNMGGTKTLPADTTFTFSNLRTGVYFAVFSGDFSPTFPAGFTYVGGERSASGESMYQIVCTDSSTPKGYYSIFKDES